MKVPELYLSEVQYHFGLDLTDSMQTQLVGRTSPPHLNFTLVALS